MILAANKIRITMHSALIITGNNLLKMEKKGVRPKIKIVRSDFKVTGKYMNVTSSQGTRTYGK